MLQLTELRPLDSLLPVTQGAPAQGLKGPLPAGRDFAHLLQGEAPADRHNALAALLPTGDALPESGKDLPVLAVSPEALAVDPAPGKEVPAGLPVELFEGAGGTLPAALTAVPAANPETPPGEAVATTATANAELAAIERMLPPLPPASPVQQAVSDAVSAGSAAMAAIVPGPARDARAESRGAAGPVSPSAVPGKPGFSAGIEHTTLSADAAQARAVDARLPATDPGQLTRQALAPAPLPAEVPVTPVQANEHRTGEPLLAAGDVRLDNLAPLQRPLPMPAAPLTATTAPATAPAIDIPVADARWGEALGERVLWMTGQKLGTAEIRMNPVELGPLRIEIKLDDNQAQVHFTAQHAATREAIEQALPRLRELFSSEGLNLANTDVSDEGVRQQRDGRDEARDGASGRAAERGELLADAEGEGLPAGASRQLARGLIDTFA